MNHRLKNAPFASADEMISTHVAIYGDTGRFCAGLSSDMRRCSTGLSPLDFRYELMIKLRPFDKDKDADREVGIGRG